MGRPTLLRNKNKNSTTYNVRQVSFYVFRCSICSQCFRLAVLAIPQVGLAARFSRQQISKFPSDDGRAQNVKQLLLSIALDSEVFLTTSSSQFPRSYCIGFRKTLTAPPPTNRFLFSHHRLHGSCWNACDVRLNRRRNFYQIKCRNEPRGSFMFETVVTFLFAWRIRKEIVLVFWREPTLTSWFKTVTHGLQLQIVVGCSDLFVVGRTI